MSKIYISILLVILSIWLVQCSFTASTKKYLPDASTITSIKSFNSFTADPEKNYQTFCAGCHGEKMDAFVDRKWKHGKSDEALFKAIKVGYPDEGMPGFDSAFTDEEIKDLADYMITGIKNFKRYESNEPVRSNIFKTELLTIRLDTVAKGFNIGWGMAFLPDGEMLVTERDGRLFRISKNKKLQTIGGVPEVLSQGQGGLLDIILHPNFKNNQVLYISYSKPKKENDVLLSTTAVTRAVLKNNKLTDQKIIFEALPYFRTKHHYGCRMVFGKDGYLYITVGDRGNEKEFPQSLNNYNGKTHRVKEDGSIPSDNPFVKTSGAVPSIYSYGHRNQQGMDVHPKTGEVWAHEHGPRGGDEINIDKKGKNYGWPVISYGINYNGKIITNKTAMEGMEQPLLYWIPSIGPSGMAFVKGNKYKGWEGNLVAGSLRFKYLNRCQLKGNKVVHEEILFKNIGRLRDVRMAPDGYIYISVENPGVILRLTPVQ
jgi:glucose/arabinose dehydrogenase